MKIISFYTKNTIYEKEIEDLISSCKALELDFYIEEREDLGCWEKNCAQKPLFICECLQKFNSPLLWIDADGIVLKKPDLNFKECDFSLYFNNRRIRHARNGTIFMNSTQRTLDFMLLWHETLLHFNSYRKRLAPDQPVMNFLLRKNQIPLNIADLPLEYTQVFDRDPIPLEETVILHFQASRTAKMAPLFWKQLKGSDLKAIRMQASYNRFAIS